MRTFGRPLSRLEGNIQMDLKGRGWDAVDWICLDEDREKWQVVVKMVMNIRVPYNATKYELLNKKPSPWN